MNIFDEAADLIRAGGHTKGANRKGGSFCLYGACVMVVDQRVYEIDRFPDVPDVLDAAAVRLFPERVNGGRSTMRFAARINDHPDTTIEDALLILKHASYEWDLQHP